MPRQPWRRLLTPGSAAPDEVCVGETDWGILGSQVRGEAREWMRPSRECMERGESQRQHLEDNQPLRKCQKETVKEWLGGGRSTGRRGVLESQGGVFQEPVSGW